MCTKIISSVRQTHKCLVEIGMVSAYAWNAMPIDGTDIISSVPAIERPLKFPMDVALAALPTPINDVAKAMISYIRLISKDARFAQELVTWLVEERRGDYNRYHKM